MKRIALFAAIMLTGFHAFCFDPGKLTDYYKFIYRAEKNIITGDYKAAAMNYDTAFLTGVPAFATDINNSMLVGVRTSDNIRILKMARMLLVKGADTAYFRRCVFNSFRRSREWDLLLKEYPTLKKQYEQNIDTKLVKQLNGMLDKDQALTYASYKSPDDPVIKKSSDSLYEEYRRLMINNDYLSEARTGVEMEDTDMHLPDYTVIIIHAFEDHSFDEKDTSILLNPLLTAIHAGKMRAAEGTQFLHFSGKIAYLFDYYYFKDTLFKSYSKDRLYDPRHRYLVSDSPTKDDVALREYLYMDTPDNLIEKMKYAFQMYCSYTHHTLDPSISSFRFGVGLNGRGARNEFSKEDKVIAVYRQ